MVNRIVVFENTHPAYLYFPRQREVTNDDRTTAEATGEVQQAPDGGAIRVNERV